MKHSETFLLIKFFICSFLSAFGFVFALFNHEELGVFLTSIDIVATIFLLISAILSIVEIDF